MIKKTITIKDYQEGYIRDKSINLSRLVQKILDEQIEEHIMK